MMDSHVINFCKARPFEPLFIHLMDGRRIEVGHPEAVTIAQYVAFLWIFHVTQQVEVIDVEKITSLETKGAVNPSNYIT